VVRGISFEFDLRGGPGMSLAQTRLSFRAGMDAPAPLRLLAPGETVGTPKMHMGFVIGDLDAAIQGMHDHIRRSVMLPQPRGRGCWVESGIGPEFELTPEEGMVVRLGAPLTSELLICEAVV
jgi:hypothetical protein